MIAITASTVLNVGDSLTLSNGNRPVRISQMPSKSIPSLRPAKLVVRAISFPPQRNCSANSVCCHSRATRLTRTSQEGGQAVPTLNKQHTQRASSPCLSSHKSCELQLNLTW